MLSVKKGVEIVCLHPAMVAALPTIMQVYTRHGYNCVITEGNDTIDRQHFSYHKTIPLQALDFRTWAEHSSEQMTMGEKQALAKDIGLELGEDYDVVAGKWNLHVEYDPK